MKGGKKKIGGASSADAAPPPPLLPTVAQGGGRGEGDGTAVHPGDDQTLAVVGTNVEGRHEQGPVEGVGDGGEEGDEEGEGEEEEDEDEEGEKGSDKFENLQIDRGEAEAERPKLAEGFYEIEAVRRKRVRKGVVQYLIKWRGWPETANTWEPLENLMSCSDIIEAFEESLRSGKNRSSRRRKRKYGGTHTQSKKKQQTSPAAATYNVPAVRVRIIEEPLPMAPLDNSSPANGGRRLANGVNNVKNAKQAKENGFETGSKQIVEVNEQSELNLKLSELRGKMAVNEENGDKFAEHPHEAHPVGDLPANGLSKVDGVELGQSSRRTGSKRRKSGSVKRFTQYAAPCVPNGGQNATAGINNGANESVGLQGSQNPDFVGNELGKRSKVDIPKNIPTITEIIKPTSYSSTMVNNVQNVRVTFNAMRSDGKVISVDNKFLKANNPLLLINFYEQHLRYSTTPERVTEL